MADTLATESPADETLMTKAAAGDTAAFDVLVRRYERPLYGYLYRMLGNAEDAQDAFQEAFMKAYAHRARFRPDAAFKPWLYAITTNCCRDRLRKRRRRRTASLDARAPEGAASLGERLPAHNPGPDAAAQAAETAQRLALALERLPVKQRAVFVMARYEGLAYQDIARALRIPAGTVKSRMKKATDTLMRALEEEG